MVKFRVLVAIGLLATGLGSAQATPISYTMDGDALLDRPFGTFTFDHGTNEFSGVSIWSSDYYSSATGTSALMQAVGRLGSILTINFGGSGLPEGVGSINFSGSERGPLTLGFTIRRSGSVNVPEPPIGLLLGLGVAGLLLGRRLRVQAR